MVSHAKEIWSIRSTKILLILSFALHLLIVGISVTFRDGSENFPLDQHLRVSLDTPPILFAILGAIATGSVISNKAINYSLLATPHRNLVFTQRSIGIVTCTLVTTLGSLIAASGLACILMLTQHQRLPQVNVAPLIVTLLSAIVLSFTLTILGTGLGFLTGSTAFGVVILMFILWGLPVAILIAEIGIGQGENLINWVPAMISQNLNSEIDRKWLGAAAGLMIWAAGSAAAGILSFRRYQG